MSSIGARVQSRVTKTSAPVRAQCSCSSDYFTDVSPLIGFNKRVNTLIMSPKAPLASHVVLVERSHPPPKSVPKDVITEGNDNVDTSAAGFDKSAAVGTPLTEGNSIGQDVHAA